MTEEGVRGEAVEIGQMEACKAFVAHVAALKMWGYDKDAGKPYRECEPPEEGFVDSHSCLMELIEGARKIGAAKGSEFDLRPWPTGKSMSLFLGAHGTSEYGEGPKFAQLQVDDDFLALLRRLQWVCRANGLSEVRTSNVELHWGPGNLDEEFQLDGPDLVVTEGSFWFTDCPGQAGWQFESDAMTFDKLTETMNANADGAVVVLCEPSAIEEEDLLGGEGDGSQRADG